MLDHDNGRRVTASDYRREYLLQASSIKKKPVDVSLVPIWRKPFDILAKGLFVQSSRGERTPIELFLRGAASMEPCVRRFILAISANWPVLLTRRLR